MPEAQANLGMLYLRGVGCERNFIEAARWCRMAADGGDAGGALGIGLVFEHGLGVPADCAEAARRYRLAADRGSDSASTALGLLHIDGRGVARDPVAARILLVGVNAQRGNSFAQAGLKQLRRLAGSDAAVPLSHVIIGEAGLTVPGGAAMSRERPA